MCNIKGSMFFLIPIALWIIILNFQECKGETNLIKLDVYNGTEITAELKGNPTTGFMWYVLNITKQLPGNDTASYVMLREIIQGNKGIKNKEKNIIVSPIKRKNPKSKTVLIGAGSTFRNNITVLAPGTYYVQYVYARASNPPEVAYEIIFEIKAKDKTVTEKENTSTEETEQTLGEDTEYASAEEKEYTSAEEKEYTSAEEKEYTSAEEKPLTTAEEKPLTTAEEKQQGRRKNKSLRMLVMIDTKMCAVGNSIEVTMKGNPSVGKIWYVYDAADESSKLKVLQQNLPGKTQPEYKQKKYISVTSPSCQNSPIHPDMVGKSCTFGSVITPKKSGIFYVVYNYKHYSSSCVKKYKFVRVDVV